MVAISVIMPVFNSQRYLRAALDSILAQSVSDFEFIIVDDGSSDGSPAILKEYQSRDARIRVISRPNTGIVGALNDGLAVATGRYIARMDGDDGCRADRFILQMQRLDADSKFIALGSCALVIDPLGDLIGTADVPLKHAEIERNHLAGQSSIFHPAVMMRTSALQNVGGYRQGLCPCEDLDLWLRLAEVGRLANLSQPLFTWRRTFDGIVASTWQRQRETIHRVLTDTWSRRGLPGVPPSIEIPTVTTTDLAQQWSWMALRHGHRRTARRYAWQTFRREPLSAGSWKLLACALRGW